MLILKRLIVWLLEDLAEIFLLGGLLGTLSSANFISILTEVDPKGWTNFGRRLDGAAG